MKMQVRLFFLLFLLPLLAAECGQGNVVENRDENGQLTERITYKTDTEERHGKYESFFASGKIMEESFYQDGLLHGPRKVYFENGQLEYLETYDKGEFEGLYQKYTEDGQLVQEGQFVNNMMSGPWKGWYDSGMLKEEVLFENNNENGPFKEYHPNGQLKTEGAYRNGDNEQGELVIFDEDGQVIERMYCEYGVCGTTWKVDEGDIQIDTAKLRRLAKIKIDAGMEEE